MCVSDDCMCVFVRVIEMEKAKPLDPQVISHTFNINALTNAHDH